MQFRKVKSWRQKMCTDYIYFVINVWEMAVENALPAIVTLRLCTDLPDRPCSEVSQSCTAYLSEPQPHLAYEHDFPCIIATEREAGLHFSAWLIAMQFRDYYTTI